MQQAATILLPINSNLNIVYNTPFQSKSSQARTQNQTAKIWIFYPAPKQSNIYTHLTKPLENKEFPDITTII